MMTITAPFTSKESFFDSLSDASHAIEPSRSPVLDIGVALGRFAFSLGPAPPIGLLDRIALGIGGTYESWTAFCDQVSGANDTTVSGNHHICVWSVQSSRCPLQ